MPKTTKITITIPEAKSGLIWLSVCLITILILNLLFYSYLDLQPPGIKEGVFTVYTKVKWHNLLELEKPVDNIILGDSASWAAILTGITNDRLGGTTIQLGNVGGSSLLMDGWMLQEYINRFGAPRNVILLRIAASYEFLHNLEFIAAVPLEWGFWTRYKLEPDWQNNELLDLFLSKYAVIYSNSDVLRKRLLRPHKFFSHNEEVIFPSEYDGLNSNPQNIEKAVRQRPKEIYWPFHPSEDAKRAIKFISDLANIHQFQLYILLAPECDIIFQDNARQQKVAAMQAFVSQFTDNKYVHLIPDSPTLFPKEEMENHNHLANKGAHKYSQIITDEIISIQNKIVSNKMKPPTIVTVNLDKNTYIVNNKISITVNLTNNTEASLSGAVSCLAKPIDSPEADWVARAAAVNFTVAANSSTDVQLNIDKGGVIAKGDYDIVVYVRTPSGSMIKEEKFIAPKSLTVK